MNSRDVNYALKQTDSCVFIFISVFVLKNLVTKYVIYSIHYLFLGFALFSIITIETNI